MLVVADVNISQLEVEFLREIEGVERVVYVPYDLRRSMPDEKIVEYALANDALVVTRDKGFQYNPRKQWKQDYPSVLLVRQVGRQLREAVRVYRSCAARGERVSGVVNDNYSGRFTPTTLAAQGPV